MHRALPPRFAFALAIAASLALHTAAFAQTAAPGAPPADAAPAQIGQVSKDSVWVPTPDRLIVRMLQLADTTRRDFVIDLGSGDGRIPIAAARLFDARALGVELEQNLVDYSVRSAKRQGVAGRATFRKQDLFETDLSQATVLTLYISPSVMEKLRPKFLDLRPGTRIVSHHFTLGDWQPDETVQAEQRHAYLWVVPARVAGRWSLKVGNDEYLIRFEQQHQLLTSAAEIEGRPTTVFAARLRGEDIQFSLLDRNQDVRNFSGRVRKDGMRGEARSFEKPALAWTAQRIP